MLGKSNSFPQYGAYFKKDKSFSLGKSFQSFDNKYTYFIAKVNMTLSSKTTKMKIILFEFSLKSLQFV